MTVGKKIWTTRILVCLVVIVSLTLLMRRIGSSLNFRRGASLQEITSHSKTENRSPARRMMKDSIPAAPDVSTAGRTVGPDVGKKKARTGAKAQRNAPEPDRIMDEVVLSFFDSSDQAAFSELAKSKGVDIISATDFGHAVRVRIRDWKRFKELLEESPTPLDYSPNYVVLSPELPPAETKENGRGYKGFGDKTLAWLGVNGDSSSWGRGITIAVLDTGVSSHPSLPKESITLVDLVGGDDVESGDYGGHGTAVASLIVGTAKDVKGIAPAARILSIKVLSKEGVGDAFTLAEGIVEAVDRGARVINLSLGTYGDSFILRQAVDFALDKGVAIVAAAGNDAVIGVTYPARYDGVLGVSAVDASGQHLRFVNQGTEIDLAAPGAGITAAWPGDDGVVAFSGTSAAVPFVSGAVAVLLSENQDLSAADAADILSRYSDDAGAPGKDNIFGYGILNIRRVQDRNVRGIYDVAVGIPYIPFSTTADDEELTVIVYVQNRGTEFLTGIDLRVEIDGVSTFQSFYNANVGETVSHEFRLNRAHIKDSGSVDITSFAGISGITDSHPANNFSRAVLLLP